MISDDEKDERDERDEHDDDADADDDDDDGDGDGDDDDDGDGLWWWPKNHGIMDKHPNILLLVWFQRCWFKFLKIKTAERSHFDSECATSMFLRFFVTNGQLNQTSNVGKSKLVMGHGQQRIENNCLSLSLCCIQPLS